MPVLSPSSRTTVALEGFSARESGRFVNTFAGSGTAGLAAVAEPTWAAAGADVDAGAGGGTAGLPAVAEPTWAAAGADVDAGACVLEFAEKNAIFCAFPLSKTVKSSLRR